MIQEMLDKLVPQMDAIIDYMLLRSEDSEEGVAMEAREFWLSLAEQPQCAELLPRHLERVVPTLLRGMRYSEVLPSSSRSTYALPSPSILPAQFILFLTTLQL